MHFHYLRTVDHYYHTDHHVETCTELTDRTILEFNVIVNPGTRMQAQPQPIEYRHHILQKRYRSLRSCRSAPWRLVQTMRIPDNGICCVVFTLNRCFYPASSVHPVSVLIPYPRQTIILWSQIMRQRKKKGKIIASETVKKQVKCLNVPGARTQQHKPGQKIRIRKKTTVCDIYV